jgi:hypothetical protein
LPLRFARITSISTRLFAGRRVSLKAGQNYVGVSANVLARAVELDSIAGKPPGELFESLSDMIGGSNAEPRSHVAVCIGFLRKLWAEEPTKAYRMPVTGLLLDRLLRGRHEDYLAILRGLVKNLSDIDELPEYIRSWARGHLIVEEL